MAAKLEVEDFYNLEAEKKLEFLSALIHDLLQAQKFEDFLKEKEDQLAEAWFAFLNFLDLKVFYILNLFKERKI